MEALEQTIKKQVSKIIALTKTVNNLENRIAASKNTPITGNQPATQDTAGVPSSGGAAGGEGVGNVVGAPQDALTRAQVVSLIARTVSDKDRRRKNVIVSGIPE